MSEFKFSCPQCGQHLSGDATLSGTQLECPVCRKPFVIPPAPGGPARLAQKAPPAAMQNPASGLLRSDEEEAGEPLSGKPGRTATAPARQPGVIQRIQRFSASAFSLKEDPERTARGDGLRHVWQGGVLVALWIVVGGIVNLFWTPSSTPVDNAPMPGAKRIFLLIVLPIVWGCIKIFFGAFQAIVGIRFGQINAAWSGVSIAAKVVLVPLILLVGLPLFLFLFLGFFYMIGQLLKLFAGP